MQRLFLFDNKGLLLPVRLLRFDFMRNGDKVVCWLITIYRQTIKIMIGNSIFKSEAHKGDSSIFLAGTIIIRTYRVVQSEPWKIAFISFY